MPSTLRIEKKDKMEIKEYPGIVKANLIIVRKTEKEVTNMNFALASFDISKTHGEKLWHIVGEAFLDHISEDNQDTLLKIKNNNLIASSVIWGLGLFLILHGGTISVGGVILITIGAWFNGTLSK